MRNTSLTCKLTWRHDLFFELDLGKSPQTRGRMPAQAQRLKRSPWASVQPQVLNREGTGCLPNHQTLGPLQPQVLNWEGTGRLPNHQTLGPLQPQVLNREGTRCLPRTTSLAKYVWHFILEYTTRYRRIQTTRIRIRTSRSARQAPPHLLIHRSIDKIIEQPNHFHHLPHE